MNTLEKKVSALENLKVRAAEFGLSNELVKSLLVQSTETGFLDDILNVAQHSMEEHKLTGFRTEQARMTYFTANQGIIAKWISEWGSSRFDHSDDTYKEVSKWGYIMDDKRLSAEDVKFYLTQPVSQCLARNEAQFNTFGSNVACVIAQLSAHAFFSIGNPNIYAAA